MNSNPPRPTARALAVVTAILFAVLSGEPAGKAAVVRVGSELEFPPYAFVDKDGQAAGFSVNLIRAVTEAMGLQIEVTSGTWDSVWNRLVAGQLDVLPIVAKLSDRAQLVDFSLSHTETYDAFFVRRGSPAFASIEAARGKEIVVMRSDAAHHALVERQFQGRLILVDTIPAGLSLVASGQHDAFLGSKLIGTLSQQKLGDGRIAAGPPIPDYKRTFCFAVKRGDSELLEKLNQGLLIIKANGEYQRIYDRWLSTEDPWSKWKRYLAPVALVLVAILLAGAVWLRTVRRLVQRATRELAEKNAQLRQIQDRLEAAVTERTADLLLTNTRLQAEIAERVKVEQTLQLNQRWLKLAHQAANAGAWDWDMNNSRLQWSPELFALFGLDPDRTQATFETWHQVLHPDDREKASGKIEQAIKERIPLSNEYRAVCPDGQVRWIHAVGNTIYDPLGKPVRMTGLCTEITARKRAEEASEQTRKTLEEAQMIAHLGSFKYVAASQTTEWSEEEYRIYGLNPEGPSPAYDEMLAKHIHPDDAALLHEVFSKAIQNRSIYELEHRIVRPDGTVRWVIDRAMPYLDAAGELCNYVGTTLDITERKKAETALELSLNEKVALLNEVHHRVKNNLQVVTSLLRMEARRSEYPATKSVLDEMKNRVLSMALLHESLYRSGTFASVDLGAYLKELTTQSFRASVVRPGAVRLQLELTSVQVEMDQALPCGLLVNELIANSLKHGFPGDHTGEVRVALKPIDGGPQLRLRVSDTGVGLPADFETKRGKSLGLQLVSDMAGQIDGRLEIGPGPGAVFDVTFTPWYSMPSPSTP